MRIVVAAYYQCTQLVHALAVQLRDILQKSVPRHEGLMAMCSMAISYMISHYT